MNPFRPKYNIIFDICDLRSVAKTRIENILFNLKRNITADGERIPDIIVILGANKYVLHHLSKKDWTKYYFQSKKSSNLGRSTNITHLVLSRWPLIRNQTFGDPITDITDIGIPLNEVPIRCDYEDNIDVNIDLLTIVASTTNIVQNGVQQVLLDPSQAQTHIKKVEMATSNNPNVFFVGMHEEFKGDSEIPDDEQSNYSILTFKSFAWKANGMNFERGIWRYFFSLVI